MMGDTLIDMLLMPTILVYGNDLHEFLNYHNFIDKIYDLKEYRKSLHKLSLLQ